MQPFVGMGTMDLSRACVRAGLAFIAPISSCATAVTSLDSDNCARWATIDYVNSKRGKKGEKT